MNYKGKRVLVTGADGFIGSHLAEMLVHNEAEVKALVHYNSFNTWGWLDKVSSSDKMEIICGDVRDYNQMLKVTGDVDIIFHLAALIAIPYSYVAPASYIDTNINGTLNICQSALINQVQQVIHTSTSEVYGTAQYVPIDESHPLQPQSPYSATKIGADVIAKSFFHSFGLPLCIARPFNTFGPRQSARAVIPTIITQIASGQKKIKLGDTTPTRDLNYVLDTCKGFLLLGLSGETGGETVNIGSGQEHSILEVFNTIRDIMGKDVLLVQDPVRIRPENSEVFRLLADIRKIRKLVDYEPEYSLEKGLRETIDWFSDPANLASYKPDIYNV
jgi:NAD dependent epimerase/dehydratase